MSASIDNFTVTDVNFFVSEGQNIAGVQASAIITFTPNTGYAIDATDFSLIATVPSEINASASTFTQSGDNVTLVAVFVDPTIMPSANVEIPLCVQGFTTLIQITLSGTYYVTSSNATPVNGTSAGYSLSGNYNTTQQVANVNLLADAGYYFQVEPTTYITNGISSDYTITSTINSNSNGYVIGKNVFVNYTFPNLGASGDVINFNASAVLLPTAPPELINSYSIPMNNINQSGENRIITLLGGPGADWTVTATGNGLNFTETGVVLNSGSSPVTIPFPSGSGQTYTITITGDLISPFPLSNPLTLYQAANTSVNFTPTTGGGSNLTIVPVTIFRSALAGSTPITGSQQNVFTLNYDITAASLITIDNVISDSDWVIPTLNGTVVTITNSEIFYTNTGVDTAVTLRATATIGTYGNSNIVIGLLVDNLVSVPAVLPSFPSSINQGTSLSCAAVTTVYYYDGSGSLPVVNDLVYADDLGTTALSNGHYNLSNGTVLVVGGGSVNSTFSCQAVTPVLTTMSDSYSSDISACFSGSYVHSVYFVNNQSVAGATVYTDIALTQIFIGDGTWYKLFGATTPEDKAISINSSGIIGATERICNIP